MEVGTQRGILLSKLTAFCWSYSVFPKSKDCILNILEACQGFQRLSSVLMI